MPSSRLDAKGNLLTLNLFLDEFQIRWLKNSVIAIGNPTLILLMVKLLK